MSSMSTCANTVLVAAAVAAAVSHVAFAQAPPTSIDPAQQLVQQIAALRAEGGPAAPGIGERLHLLGLLYQEADDHAAASVALEEARYVTRVREGLSSVDEALLLRQQIRSEEALRRYERVWNLQQDMVAIARKHLDNSRVVPIFRDLAEDRTALLEQYRFGDFPPEIHLGCYYSSARPRYDNPRSEQRPYVDSSDSCRFGVRDEVVKKLREEIQLFYAEAIEVLLRNGDYASQELRDLERRALGAGFFAPYRTLPSSGNATLGETRFVGVELGCPEETLDELLATDLLGDCLGPIVHSEGHVIANAGSWVSLVRLIAYEIRTGAPAADRASAFVELADWHLRFTPFDRRHLQQSTETALEVYGRAHREFQLGADARASTAQAFSPEVPVTLPTDEPNPFTSASALGSSRYIDASFFVTKYGMGERVVILAASNDVTRDEKRDLIRLIESTSFRPRFVDGALADSAPVTVRYRLSP